jgi:protoporphyrinogen oxidase
VGRLAEKLAESVAANGGIVRTSSPVELLRVVDGKRVEVELEDGEGCRHDHVISTLPLGQFVDRLPNVPEDIRQRVQRLKVRATILVYAQLSTPPVFDDHWILLMSPDARVCRVTDFANFQSTSVPGRGILCAEIWCSRHDPIFRAEESTLATLTERDLRRSGILPSTSAITDFHLVRLPTAIPVLSLGYFDALEAAAAHLGRKGNFSTIGRFGRFGNESIHSSIIQGIELADALLD